MVNFSTTKKGGWELVRNWIEIFFFSLIQITISLEQQVTESSLCERNTPAGLSTQGEEDANHI